MASPSLDPNQDDEGTDTGSGSKSALRSAASTALSLGWNIGKKAAVAGAAVTSVPVVLPPIFTFSAFGLAFAVPFGVYFAGFACTDRVMRSLLSDAAPAADQPALYEALDREGVEDQEADHAEEFAKKEEAAVDQESAREEDAAEEVVKEEAMREDASYLSSSYESAVEDQFSDADKKKAEPPVADNQQGLYTEEKIWEQMSAIRSIMGYRAAMHSSYIEELRALYLFTGIDPPPLSKGSSDLMDINDKLQSLKSVVGVK